MRTTAGLKQERARLRAEAQANLAASAADNRALTEAEAATDDALNAKLEALDKTLVAHERTLEWERTAAPAVGGSGVTGMHDRAAEKPWASFGEQLIAVARAQSPSGAFPGAGEVDPRIMAVGSGMAVGNPGDGGVLIQTDYSSALLQAGMAASKLVPLTFQVPIGPNSDGVEMPFIDDYDHSGGSVAGGVQVYRRAEADTVASSKPALDALTLRLEDMMGLAYMTERLLQDAGALEAIVTRSFEKQFAYRIDREIIRGTGVGQCLGILNSAATITVSKELNQVADTIVSENLGKMWSRLPVESRGSAVWLVNQDVEPQLDSLYTSVGLGAFDPRFVSYGIDGIQRIRGRPVVPLEQLSTLGDLGDIFLADFSQYLFITKGGMKADQSIHVRFIYGERTFRWMVRNNGRPLWKSARTPENSATTISPFVMLQAR